MKREKKICLVDSNHWCINNSLLAFHLSLLSLSIDLHRLLPVDHIPNIIEIIHSLVLVL
jgi:hypothetical protein